MTTRSRTGLFRSYRDSQARSTRQQPHRRSAYDETDFNSDEHDQLISNTNHVLVNIPQLPPIWVDVSDQVEDILADTQAKIHTLDKLHAKHVLPGFSDRSQEERDIEALTTDITKAFRSCQSLIQKIANSPHQFPPDPQKSRHGALTGKNVQRGLAAKVQDLSATFRKKQRVYMEKLQGHATKNQDLLLASGTMSLKGSDGLNAVDDDILAASHTRAQSQSLIQTESSHELQARDRELTEIAKSIASLAELFKDLSVLVIDQGTLLDSVEFNIEQTVVHMEDSVKELTIATRYQKNTGKRK
ncbi:syntaxin-like t-SNARE protein TLG2 [Phlegmacium glaucopus]|nr:syntaxin-like t-SNARE protein TLG2 [Phlegmacium glaucopus]